MKTPSKIKSLLRTALLLFAGIMAYCAPMETRASDSCYRTATLPTPSCSISYSSYVYITWGSLSASCYAFYNPRYVVYRSTSSTFSWSSVTRLTTTTNKYYYDYSAVCGTTYYYWIGVVDESDGSSVWVNYDKKDWGKRSDCDNCLDTVPNPQPTASISYRDYIYISWPAFGTCSKFSGKYAVYRSTSSTFSWSSVSKRTETTSRYYYDYSASCGTTYYYWIGVLGNDGKWYVQESKKDWGKRSDCDNCLDTVPNPQPTASTTYCDYIYISWPAFGTCSKFSGKYAVYRSTSSTFSWSSVSKRTETTNRYYYDYSATPGTTYYYWIGVLGTDGKWYVQSSKYVWGKRSSSSDCGNCMDTVPNPQPTASTTYCDYIYISWPAFGTCSKFSGKYAVYRSTSSTFSWSSVSKRTETTNRYYYDYSATPGTTYYYWIGVLGTDGKWYVQSSKYDWGKRSSSSECGNCLDTVPNPQPTASISYSSYIYISWPAFGSCSKFSGKYAVYRSTSSTFSWSSVRKLTETYNLYYYDYSATSGTTYYYWIGVLGTDGKWYVQSSKYDWGRRSY